MTIVSNIVFDTPKNNQTPRLTFAPRPLRDGLVPASEADWARVYGAYSDFDAARDAAGYETAAEMNSPDASRKVLLVEINPNGEIHVGWGGKAFHLTPGEVFEQFGMDMPSGYPWGVPEMVWMGGPAEGVFEGAFAFGPFYDKSVACAFLKEGEVLLGQTRNGESRDYFRKIGGDIIPLENGLDDVRAILDPEDVPRP